MKSLIKSILGVVVFSIVLACTTGTKPIDYGNEGCHFCKMTIVDKIHGAELITDKGKVFKFDATECLLNYKAENIELQTVNIHTNHYEAPTAFITAEEATFLISEKLPSPMGANLTAFQSKETAEKIQTELGGKLYNWEALKAHLASKE